MNMNMNNWSIIFTVLFILIITTTLCVSCTNVSPFDAIFPRYSKLEGFAPNNGVNKYVNIKDTNKQDTNNQFLINKQETVCDKIFGFNGLLCNQTNAIDKIDMFADAPGKLTCKSSLSNSKGPLCLTDEHKKLLTTRGGNKSGDNDEYSQ